MREIKFRAWCGTQSRMFSKVIVGNLSDPSSDDYTAHCIYRDGSWYHVDHYDADVFFMQYTGLMDSEGVDIYEGDIVPFNGEHLKCIIDTDGVWFENDNVTMRHDDFKKYGESLKVIGSIHENPELLS